MGKVIRDITIFNDFMAEGEVAFQDLLIAPVRIHKISKYGTCGKLAKKYGLSRSRIKQIVEQQALKERRFEMICKGRLASK